MRKFLLTLILLIGVHLGNAQNNEILADSYYKKGEFKKALIIYQNLLKEKPYSYNFIFKVWLIFNKINCSFLHWNLS